MELEPFTPTCLDRASSPLFTFLSPISSPASPIVDFAISQPEDQKQLTSGTVPVSPTFNALLNKSHPFPSCYPESEDEPQQSSSSRRNVKPLPLLPKHPRSQPQVDTVTLRRQHKREYFASQARAIKRPRFNRHLQYELKPEFSSWKITHWDSSRQEFTLKSTSLPSQQILVPLKAITAKRN